MKINEKLKVFLSGIGIVAVIGVTVVTMMYPEYIKYPYSYKDISLKQDTLESQQNRITSSESLIPQQILEKEKLQTSVDESIKENEKIKSQFDFENLKYHLPSLLVTLEQGAIDAGIKEEAFYIEFDSIKTNVSTGGAGAADPYMDSNDYPDKPNRGEDEPINPGSIDPELEQANPGMPEENNMDTPENMESPGDSNADIPQIEHALSNGDLSAVIAMDVSPIIPGISVTTIPIKATNLTYGQAREYLRFLDNLDFVEPSFVDIYSDGDTVALIILIHVFHEGGANNGQ